MTEDYDDDQSFYWRILWSISIIDDHDDEDRWLWWWQSMTIMTTDYYDRWCQSIIMITIIDHDNLRIQWWQSTTTSDDAIDDHDDDNQFSMTVLEFCIILQTHLASCLGSLRLAVVVNMKTNNSVWQLSGLQWYWGITERTDWNLLVLLTKHKQHLLKFSFVTSMPQKFKLFLVIIISYIFKASRITVARWRAVKDILMFEGQWEIVLRRCFKGRDIVRASNRHWSAIPFFGITTWNAWKPTTDDHIAFFLAQSRYIQKWFWKCYLNKKN